MGGALYLLVAKGEGPKNSTVAPLLELGIDRASGRAQAISKKCKRPVKTGVFVYTGALAFLLQ